MGILDAELTRLFGEFRRLAGRRRRRYLLTLAAVAAAFFAIGLLF